MSANNTQNPTQPTTRGVPLALSDLTKKQFAGQVRYVTLNGCHIRMFFDGQGWINTVINR